MPRRQPPRQLHAMRSPACRAVSSKPNELRRESPSPYLVLLRLPPGRRPVETLVPVQPAATLRRNKASVSLRRPCHSVAAIPAAIVKLERAGITHSKSQSATRRLLHFWLEKCAHLKLESTQRFARYPATPRTQGSQTGLPRLKQRFAGYPATPRTRGSQTGLPRLKQRFAGYTAATRNPELPDGLAPSEAKVHGLHRGNENPGLPDGLDPSEAKVHGLHRGNEKPQAPRRAYPV
jgi:hypothetical protein